MIQEFLSGLAEEQPLDGDDMDVLDQSVQATLKDVDPDYDYCQLGLKTHALVFSLWPIMGQAYEQLLAIVKDWSGVKSDMLMAFEERLQSNLAVLRESYGLTVKEWLLRRERVYLDMYTSCSNGLGAAYPSASLSECLALKSTEHHGHVEKRLRTLTGRTLQGTATECPLELERLVSALMNYFAREQAIDLLLNYRYGTNYRLLPGEIVHQCTNEPLHFQGAFGCRTLKRPTRQCT